MTVEELTDALSEIWRNITPQTTVTVVDHGLDCVDRSIAKRTPPGTKVRVRLELNGATIQCRPGVVTHTRGHMGPGWVYVDFGNCGAWFERDRVSLEQEA